MGLVGSTNTILSFSPLFIAVGSATGEIAAKALSLFSFQSAFHHGRECNILCWTGYTQEYRLSVRFSSR